MTDFPEDKISMRRYRIESIAFAPDLASVMVRFEDPREVGGPILSAPREYEISLRDDEEMRTKVWEIVDFVCDLVDEAYAAHRRAR